MHGCPTGVALGTAAPGRTVHGGQCMHRHMHACSMFCQNSGSCRRYISAMLSKRAPSFGRVKAHVN